MARMKGMEREKRGVGGDDGQRTCGHHDVICIDGHGVDDGLVGVHVEHEVAVGVLPLLDVVRRTACKRKPAMGVRALLFSLHKGGGWFGEKGERGTCLAIPPGIASNPTRFKNVA